MQPKAGNSISAWIIGNMLAAWVLAVPCIFVGFFHYIWGFIAVLLAHGLTGYMSGIRIAQGRPLRFTTGDLIGSNVGSISVLILFWAMLLTALVPIMVLPRQWLTTWPWSNRHPKPRR